LVCYSVNQFGLAVALAVFRFEVALHVIAHRFADIIRHGKLPQDRMSLVVDEAISIGRKNAALDFYNHVLIEVFVFCQVVDID
jgi:hypothetical protein